MGVQQGGLGMRVGGRCGRGRAGQGSDVLNRFRGTV